MFVEAKENYQSLCYDCHGSTGKGDGPQSKTFSLESPDFTLMAYWDQTSNDQIIKAIKDGKGEDMPDFKKKLSQQQIEELLNMMKISYRPKY